MFADIIMVIILAIIQGFTEFLPVSSSGHLVIAEALMGAKDPSGGGNLIFEVAVHVGTLGAVAAFYRRKIRLLCESLPQWAASGFRRDGGHRAGISYIGWIILGSVPAAAVGLLLRDRITALFDSPAVVSVLLVATGLFLLSSRGRGGNSPLDARTVILIGIAQAVAILPGCSRSGWTITMALLAGTGFETAAEFSFMLSIPAILGALALELLDAQVSISGSSLILLLVSVAAAFVSGFAALRLLVHILKNGLLHRFAWYLLPAGALFWIYFTFIGR